MERMGDILARTATRRAGLSRPTEGAAPAAPRDGGRHEAARPTAPRRPAPGAARGPLGRAGRVVPRPSLAADAPQAPRPAARPGVERTSRADLREPPPGAGPTAATPDVRSAAEERILEMPAGYVATSPARFASSAIPNAMQGDASPAANEVRPTPLRAAANQPGDNGPPRARRAEAPRSAGSANQATTAAAGRSVCPHCGGAGYVRSDLPLGHPLFGKAVRCECRNRELKEKDRSDLLRRSSLEAFRHKDFKNFDARVQGLQEAFDAARKFAADPQGWLVLSGPHGVGKTHLAAAIANWYLDHDMGTVFFSIVPDLLDHLRAAFAPTSEVPYDTLFDRIRESGLLVLDDLGAENSTAWATEKLFQLINYRYNNGYPTVITTNSRLLTQMDDRIRSRLSDISLARRCIIEAQDYRERHVNRPRRSSGGGGQGNPGPRW